MKKNSKKNKKKLTEREIQRVVEAMMREGEEVLDQESPEQWYARRRGRKVRDATTD